MFYALSIEYVHIHKYVCGMADGQTICQYHAGNLFHTLSMCLLYYMCVLVGVKSATKFSANNSLSAMPQVSKRNAWYLVFLLSTTCILIREDLLQYGLYP